MCDNPNTFQGPVTTVMNEQNLHKRFNLCATSSPTIQEEEPMEIGHVRPRKCYKYHKLGHIVKHCKCNHQSKSHVNAVSEQWHWGGTIDPEIKITSNHDCVDRCFSFCLYDVTIDFLKNRTKI